MYDILDPLRAQALKGYTKSNWITIYILQPYDNVIIVEDPYTTKKIVLNNIVGKTYISKRELIREIGIAENELPKEYSIRS